MFSFLPAVQADPYSTCTVSKPEEEHREVPSNTTFRVMVSSKVFWNLAIARDFHLSKLILTGVGFNLLGACHAGSFDGFDTEPSNKMKNDGLFCDGSIRLQLLGIQIGL
ncbi:hypothetical protein NPIL_195781 [Nephila pilipes]|uniref:Uncharacterized protein n=1 Tax=Nephila pilipes TaxID=299642 RepID=A0A8X6NH83_NEPPI|nr:hypothetical protein NPIL_195781 [Nephila pilipes]